MRGAKTAAADRIGCVVAGAGVVGLAIARAMALRGRDVLVLEAAGSIGTATSSRNSEVIHAGLYYAPDSLRARLCVAGRHALYDYCAAHGVQARRCGKLIVAADAQEAAELGTILARGEANGVEGLALLTRTQALALEPELSCAGALLSPMTGILDSHGFMLSLQGEAADQGAGFAFNAPLLHAEVTAEGFALQVGGVCPMRIDCATLINAAGLGACALASRIDGLDPGHVPTAYLAKGSYFAMSGRAPFRHLIYPVPIPGGAGIHLTLDLAGAARFGPDVEAVDAIDFSVDPARAAMFAASVRRYWPGLPRGALQPAYAGIRPKIVPATQSQDFVIQGPHTHGVAGLVNLFGIESPGLTASLAIAGAVSDLLA